MGIAGLDFLCLEDFTPLFDTTDEDALLIRQYVYHKLIASALMKSEAPDGWINWGCNVRQYMGQGFTDAQIAALGPTIAIKLADDPDGPIASAEVISRRATTGPAFEMTFAITVQTALGPLRFVADIGVASARMRE